MDGYTIHKDSKGNLHAFGSYMLGFVDMGTAVGYQRADSEGQAIKQHIERHGGRSPALSEQIARNCRKL